MLEVATILNSIKEFICICLKEEAWHDASSKERTVTFQNKGQLRETEDECPGNSQPLARGLQEGKL